MKNSFLFSVIFVIIAAGLYSQIMYPWITNALTKYQQIEDLRSVFAQGQDLQVRRDALRSELNAVPASQQDLVRNAIPEYSPGNIVLFLLALDALMKEKSGLPLDTKYVVGTEQEDGAGAVLLPVSFTFGEISYDSLRRFMQNLQRWERGVRIRSVQVGLPVDEDLAERGFVRATIAGEALFSSSSDTL
ncbi:MAG: hypothetical protein OXB96_03120 [Candidatus Kaiserbacteria bacterium]|nr:hypothetical protein [Candidatus Kaiserbacteria bacterium]